MQESYIEGRFGIVMEEIRDALADMAEQLSQINERLRKLDECVDTRTKLPVLRVADMTTPPR